MSETETKKDLDQAEKDADRAWEKTEDEIDRVDKLGEKPEEKQ